MGTTPSDRVGLRDLQDALVPVSARSRRHRRRCAPDEHRAPIDLRGRPGEAIPAPVVAAPHVPAGPVVRDPVAATLAAYAAGVGPDPLPDPRPASSPGSPVAAEPVVTPAVPAPPESPPAPEGHAVAPGPAVAEASAWDEDADVAEAAAFADDLARILATAVPQASAAEASDAGQFLQRAAEEAPQPLPATPPVVEEGERVEPPRPTHEVFERMASFANQFDAGTVALDLEQRFAAFDREAAATPPPRLESFSGPSVDAFSALEDLARIAELAPATPAEATPQQQAAEAADPDPAEAPDDRETTQP